MMSKTWLVTGTHTGFGKQLAIQLAQHDDINLVATSRKAGQLDYLDQYDHGQIAKVILDVTKHDQVVAAVKSATERFGGIDVLVNNAGLGYFGTFEESNLEDVKYMFDVNVWGLVDMTRETLPIMRKQKSGVIVNFSSIGGLYSFPTLSFYHGTKYAVEGITGSIEEEVKGLGIKTMLVEPSGFRTDWAGRSSHKTMPTHDDYEQFTKFIDDMANGAHHEPGDPVMAAEIIIDQVTNHSDQLPTHLPLGKISSDLAIDKYTKLLQQFKDERELSLSADRPERNDN
ncbi:SDR family NAD(P)-dependent oxidoreductase [Limosilactobacillus sp.]|uniref:SDR family NAD(P)-dependent oxidoreductase n=1 Tax=Limosilactobacillus sp. TaxID=2773925 RepID=UPI0025C00E21|nr:SDR family NAD(P)-dependent oxidoreductase [Limosilactobacillus sp.]MCH3921489.1 SDR family NAD(P)-dependent oxidoreductase [Limosilactobacillus sp.]MCH3928260.1 SDR family NAD(P)-dependent oxidoreductase [Limosilactobacillus sp.]